MSDWACCAESLRDFYLQDSQEAFDPKVHVPGGQRTWTRAKVRSFTLNDQIRKHKGNPWEFFRLLAVHGPTGRWSDWARWCKEKGLDPAPNPCEFGCRVCKGKPNNSVLKPSPKGVKP